MYWTECDYTVYASKFCGLDSCKGQEGMLASANRRRLGHCRWPSGESISELRAGKPLIRRLHLASLIVPPKYRLNRKHGKQLPDDVIKSMLEVYREEEKSELALICFALL